MNKFLVVYMIKSRDDYEFYLKADKLALGLDKERYQESCLPWWITSYFFDDVWKFERLLRKTEYYQNCKTSKIGRAHYYYLRLRLHKEQIKLGFFINPNCFGPGLAIVHPGTIVVNGNARIGANCRIYSCVVIGVRPGQSEAPTIGDDVYIGPGAKIYGDITIADGIVIGANSVVNKSFLEPNITIAGIPARKISDKGSNVIRATALLKAQHPE